MTDPQLYAAHRPRLVALAYRMLGSASEAEDVVQDAFVRVHTAAPADVRSPAAYLTTIVTRLCLDRLKAARTAREAYLGPWLPEPVLTVDAASDPHTMVEQHESITLAFLVLLESLTPQERAVFLLRDVFGYSYAEIAHTLGASVANCRQVLHRAKAQIEERRPRFAAQPAQHRELVTRFLAAAEQGAVDALTELLAQDVTLWADSNGKLPAPTRPLVGREVVAKTLAAFDAKIRRAVADTANELRVVSTVVNGEPAVLVWIGKRLDTVLVISVVEERIGAIRVIRNPDKLVYLAHQVLARTRVGHDLG